MDLPLWLVYSYISRMLDKYNAESNSIDSKPASNQRSAQSLTTFGAMHGGRASMKGVPAGQIAAQVEALKRERNGKNS